MEDPTNRVRRKPKGDRPKLNTGSHPEFSAPRYTDVEKENYQGSGADLNETAYLKRLSLRSKLVDSKYANFVPDLSDLELETGRQMAILNAFNRSDNPADRGTLEILFSRFGSRSLFAIAQEISQLKLSKQSIYEIEQLVVGGPQGMLEAIVGVERGGQPSSKGQRARERAAFAAITYW